MKFLFLSWTIFIFILAGNTRTCAQTHQPPGAVPDSVIQPGLVKTKGDTISNSMSGKDTATTPATTKKKKTRKQKNKEEGDNPYVNTTTVKPIPYNSPREKMPATKEPVAGEILKDIIKEKKRN